MMCAAALRNVTAVVLAAALVVALGSSIADAKPGLKPVVDGPVMTFAVSGGYVGVNRPGQPFLLIHEATGSQVSVPVPFGCAASSGMRFPMLLVNCGDERVLNVETGDLQPVPQPPLGAYRSCELGPPTFSVLGLYWIEGGCGVHSSTFVSVYRNWRTGEVRYGSPSELDQEPGPPFYNIDTPDLDASQGYRCPELPGLYPSRPKWVAYRTKTSPKLRLRRCRGGRSIVLSDRNTATGITGKRAAAWVAGTKVGLYMTDSGRRYRWNAPRTDDGGSYVVIQLSDRYLYVKVVATDGASRLYRAALPRRMTAGRSITS